MKKKKNINNKNKMNAMHSLDTKKLLTVFIKLIMIKLQNHVERVCVFFFFSKIENKTEYTGFTYLHIYKGKEVTR